MMSWSDGLRLAASPTLLLMALVTALSGPADIVCGAHASPLTGMVPMYLLMSAFHAPPWLKRFKTPLP
jgi:hypothetical protein